jgi:CBS-domain-containing membrane protein
MTNAHVVSRSPSSIEIGFKGRDFVDAYKVYVNPNPDLATIAIDNLLHSAAKRPKNRQGRPLSGRSIRSASTQSGPI